MPSDCFSLVFVMLPILLTPVSSRQKSSRQSRALSLLLLRVSVMLMVFVVDQTKLTGIAETDSIFPTSKRHESEEILLKTGQPYQINLFSGVEHGFAVRADITKPTIRFAKEAAFMQATAWFNQYL
jgi:hypothetical protein